MCDDELVDGGESNLAPDAKPLCPNCLTELPPGIDFCPSCQAPVGAFTTYDPFKQIFATGWMYRRAVGEGSSRLALFGLILIFAPSTLIVAIAVSYALLTGSRDLGSTTWLGTVGLVVVYVALLRRAVIGYRNRRRVLAGCCGKCGYDLRDLPEPRCPECGTPFDPRNVESDNTDDAP